MVMDRLSQEERGLKDLNTEYTEKYGFSDPENYTFKSGKGLSAEVVREISQIKGEPDWMREFRLKSLDIFRSKPMPRWGGDIGIDWHGHRDRDFALANTIAAIAR